MVVETFGNASHILAAILFAAVGIWQWQRGVGAAQQRVLIAALLATAAWALSTGAMSPAGIVPRLTENIRNLAWLGFMLALLRQASAEHQKFAVSILYAVLLLIGLGLALIDLLPLVVTHNRYVVETIFFSALVLRMMMAIGALVLVHNLYTAAAPDARWGIRLPMVALAVMWTYDLNLYTVAYLANGWSPELFAARGLVMAGTALLFALAARRNAQWQMRLSRTVAFSSISLVAIGGYLILMALVTSALEYIGGGYAHLAQTTFVFGTALAALVLLPSARFRAWFKVKISKHFFAHRYDYRSEWIRFTDTLGRPADGAAPLDERIIQAVADITESPAGWLLVPGEDGGLAPQTRWNWDSLDPPMRAAGALLVQYLETSGRIIELDALRLADGGNEEEARLIPEWMIVEGRAWALVPLVHFDRLQGAVLLARSRVDRSLDWEDYDLLRVVGRQVASYLAEANGQEALNDAQRFDEFNRRFAFIMHDIKNLVSQLSLVTRNAERHADNPDFRADMIATLKSSVGKMNDLLARLSQHNKGRPEEPRAVSATRIVEGAAAARNAHHPVVSMISGDPIILADPARLSQALEHIVQNAIDASPASEPVILQVIDRGDEIAIEVRDKGAGMPQDFLRTSLFRPFASTKEGGFGIGAYEARSLIVAMGGRIEVESREGTGSTFTILLPSAHASAGKRMLSEPQ